MFKYLLSFAFLSVASGFTTIARPASFHSSLHVAASAEDVTYFEDLDLAVECATHFGLCEVDALNKLADKVEAGAGSCLFEVDEALCEKEIADRKDVAEVLRLQSELRLRMDALEESNLFAGDVRDEHNIRERDEAIEILSEDGV